VKGKTMAKRRRIRRRRINLGAVTKQDFVAIANILCSEGASARVKQRFADYFGSQNPRFDTGRFLKATNACSR
jgi:hypothetical protein